MNQLIKIGMLRVNKGYKWYIWYFFCIFTKQFDEQEIPVLNQFKSQQLKLLYKCRSISSVQMLKKLEYEVKDSIIINISQVQCIEKTFSCINLTRSLYNSNYIDAYSLYLCVCPSRTVLT